MLAVAVCRNFKHSNLEVYLRVFVGLVVYYLCASSLNSSYLAEEPLEQLMDSVSDMSYKDRRPRSCSAPTLLSGSSHQHGNEQWRRGHSEISQYTKMRKEKKEIKFHCLRRVRMVGKVNCNGISKGFDVLPLWYRGCIYFPRTQWYT